MGQMTWNSCELLPSQTCELYAPREEAQNSRTSLKRYLLDPVLPVVTLLAMGALAMAMLLLVVTAVGDMEQVLRGGGTVDDPWSCAATATSPQTYATYVARADATQESGAWAGPPVENAAGTQVAQDTAQP